MALSKEQFKKTALERMRDADTFWHNWRTTAIEEYDFVSGKQWSRDDEVILNAEKRPPVTFNYSEKMIDAVVGAEVSNRQEAVYKPQGVEDSGLAELWNSAAKWAREETDGEDEESDAFRDMLITGMGWTQTRMDYSEDLDGKIVIERIDPLEMRSDPAASKRGITDRRYHYRKWWVDEAEAKREWPNTIFTAFTETDATGVITHQHRYEDEVTSEVDRHKDQVQITHYECVELDYVYRVAMEGGIKEMSVADFNDMKDELDQAQIQYTKQRKKIYYTAFFAGETMLDMDPSACQEGFTFIPITGKRDRNKNTFYGLTRVMKDPQRWANKWLSQIMHIINSNAKGGLMAEVNAFVDPQKAQEDWAKADSITLFNEGALSGNKVSQKQVAPYPSGLDKLMQFALGSLPMVTGINLEALGLANREQAGVLEAQRKQAAYGLLAPLFDALRRYRKTHGRLLLAFIHEFISDGRLVRIGGPDSEQFLPLTKQPDAPRMDIIVDQSPTAPDTKERTWEVLTTLVPTMLKAGMPLPPDLLDYSPLPPALAAKWKAFAAQQPKSDPRMQQLQEQLQQLQEENTALKQDAQVEQAALQQKGQQAQAELVLKKHIQEAEIELKRDEANAEFRLKARELEQQMEIKRMEAGMNVKLKEKQIEGDHAIKKQAASEANATAKESGKMNGDASAKAIEKLAEAIKAPRKLITDKSGKPTGIKPA